MHYIGIEVDFVLYGPDFIYAIEVKNTNTIRPRDIKGLQLFKEDYPEAKAILLYRGTEKLKKHDILCLPCDTFIKEIIPDKPLIY